MYCSARNRMGSISILLNAIQENVILSDVRSKKKVENVEFGNCVQLRKFFICKQPVHMIFSQKTLLIVVLTF